MALNYKPLWIQLAKKGLKKTDVIAMAGLTTNVISFEDEFEKEI